MRRRKPPPFCSEGCRVRGSRYSPCPKCFHVDDNGDELHQRHSRRGERAEWRRPRPGQARLLYAFCAFGPKLRATFGVCARFLSRALFSLAFPSLPCVSSGPEGRSCEPPREREGAARGIDWRRIDPPAQNSRACALAYYALVVLIDARGRLRERARARLPPACKLIAAVIKHLQLWLRVPPVKSSPPFLCTLRVLRTNSRFCLLKTNQLRSLLNYGKN